MGKLSPMMQQYMHLKDKHQDCMLFFRLGDFYELFFDDALKVSEELDLTLTGRDCGLEEKAPMCGVPHHAVDIYINRLLKKGYKVAICEQITLPKKGVSIVERDVVRIVTPGTVIEDSLLDENSNNYIASICKEDNKIGISYADISTGEFFLSSILQGNVISTLFDELTRLNPAEILVNKDFMEFVRDNKKISKTFILQNEENLEVYYTNSYASSILKKHFGSDNDILSNADLIAINSAGALLQYLSVTQKNALLHINKIKEYSTSQYMGIDNFTRNSLELTKTIRNKTKKGSLLWVLDKTSTSLGSRKLKQWLEQPLLNKDEIKDRLDAVEYIKDNSILKSSLQEELKKIKDIERLTTKIAYSSINPRECVMLMSSLRVLPEIKKLINSTKIGLIDKCFSKIDDLSDVYQLLDATIVDDPPVNLKEGGVIKGSYNEELAKLKNTSEKGKSLIEAMEIAERQSTGIKNLKIKYNRVFGYFIEVTKSNIDQVPYRYVRRQTLANCERYITQELKELEDSILGAKDKIIALEQNIYNDVKNALKSQIERLQQTAEYISVLDVLVALATVANENNYVKPEINSEGVIDIKEGRHPVVEMSSNVSGFVPNDAHLSTEDDRLIIITGPNMSGKSTYLRQTAVITIMAHIGSFVPAMHANISITDKVFSRVGASDDLFLGQSTFMVEMSEVAHILKNATKNSLIILDEIGRGTSTFDGLSIAWSVIEYISDAKKIGAKTLFATHYHQLSELEGSVDGVKNYCVAVREFKKDIIFMRKIVRGGSDKSFGLHVAKLAGVPESVIERGEELLLRLENADINNKSITETVQADSAQEKDNNDELFSDSTIRLIEELKEMDLTTTTPIEAFFFIKKIKDEL